MSGIPDMALLGFFCFGIAGLALYLFDHGFAKRPVEFGGFESYFSCVSEFARGFFLIFSVVKTFGRAMRRCWTILSVVGIDVFLISAVSSYRSIRFGKKYAMLERAADTIFIFGLILPAITATVILFQVIH